MKAKTKTNHDPATALGALSAAWDLGGPDYVVYRISLLAKLLDRQTATQLQKEAGLSVAEWRVLAQLNAKSPATVRMIADLAWVDRAEVSRAAASLVEKGLVQRRDNPDDKRSTLFSFTPDGLSLFGRMRPMRRGFQSDLRNLLSTEQQEVLDEALLILAQESVTRLNGVRRK